MLLAGLMAAAAVLVVRAPATLLDVVMNRATQGRVRLAQVSGTVWAGQGRIVVSDSREAIAAGQAERASALPGLAIPGVFGWRLSPWPLLVGMVEARLTHDSMDGDVVVSGRAGRLRATRGQLVLPALSLERLGSPWTTIRPSGTLTLSWGEVTLSGGRFEGKAAIELSQVASALTPVSPLGAYRIEITGSGAQAGLTMKTLVGPLKLAGEGRWDARSGLRFTAEASADESEQARLGPLLVLMGRRDGERTIIKLGA
jgi:general secretion pathway protein N